MNNLAELNLRSNKELDWVETFNKLSLLLSLTTLDLSYNSLESLPSEIGQLTNLTNLRLGWNELENLPVEVGQLINLKRLNLRSNNLSEEAKEEITQLLPNCDISF